jgi:hypothetical protein
MKRKSIVARCLVQRILRIADERELVADLAQRAVPYSDASR